MGFIVRLPENELELYSLAQAISDHNRLEAVLYDCLQPTVYQMVEVLQKGYTFAAIDSHTLKPIGIGWLTDVQGVNAYVHFCMLPSAHDDVDVANTVLDKMVETFKLEAIWGITPMPYRHALAFIKELNFKYVTYITKRCFMAKYDKHVDAVLTVRR